MRELSAIFFFFLLAINLILKAAEGEEEGGGFRERWAHPRWPLPQSCLLDNALCIIYNSQIFGRSILIWIPLLSDVAITIIEAIIQLSQEAIVIRPTVERKGDGTGQWFTCMAHIHWVSLNHLQSYHKSQSEQRKIPRGLLREARENASEQVPSYFSFAVIGWEGGTSFLDQS